MKPQKDNNLTTDRTNSTIRFSPAVKKALLHLKADRNKSLSDLVEEALVAYYGLDLEQSA